VEPVPAQGVLPVDGRPGITHLIDEVAALGPAEVVIIYHPYYEAFAAWARTALTRDGQGSYRRAARIPDISWPADLTVRLVPQHGPYADITSVLNGADHLTAGSDLYVAFADNLYPGDNPLLALRAAPAGHLAVLARGYQPELAPSRGVIAVAPHDGLLSRTHAVVVTANAGQVIDLGTGPPGEETPDGSQWAGS
jgi:hypothetical protein